MPAKSNVYRPAAWSIALYDTSSDGCRGRAVSATHRAAGTYRSLPLAARKSVIHQLTSHRALVSCSTAAPGYAAPGFDWEATARFRSRLVEAAKRRGSVVCGAAAVQFAIRNSQSARFFSSPTRDWPINFSPNFRFTHQANLRSVVNILGLQVDNVGKMDKMSNISNTGDLLRQPQVQGRSRMTPQATYKGGIR